MRRRAEKIALEAVMALSALNIWTGAPLLAVWVGSRAVDSTQVTMGAVFLVVVTLFATCLALIWALNVASVKHDELSGRKQSVRRHVPWLRSMRAERVDYERDKVAVTFLDRLIVVMVVLAVVAFEIWFFVASPSPIAPGPSKD
jgi:membrane-bound acyltransferase YfiQ involved in biofilm formation